MPDGRPVRCAATRSIPRGTSAPDGTASTSTEPRARHDGCRDARGRCGTATWRSWGGCPGRPTRPSSSSSTIPTCREPFHAVYKATLAERPLFDFPEGTLARREVAAFLVSEATGWGLVPPTVLREGPFGEGMVQQWVHGDPDVDLVALVVGDDPRLRRMAIFDAIVNNTDRKGGHLLPMPEATSSGWTTG